jgi:hypothetical protein
MDRGTLQAVRKIPAETCRHRTKSEGGKTDPGRAERERFSEQERTDALSGSRRPTGRARPGGVLFGLRTMKSRRLAAR